MNRRHKPINLSRSAFAHLAAALGLAVLGANARADWTLQDADFKTTSHLTINTWSIKDGLSASDQSGKLVTFPTRQVLSLSSGATPVSDPISRVDWMLTLRNGDRLYGDPAGISGKSLLFKTRDLGTLAVPLKRVESLSGRSYGTAATQPRKLASSPDHDLVIYKDNGDRLEGIVTAIDANGFKLATENSDQPTNIDASKVMAVVFGGAKPPREIPPLSLRLSMVSGSVYTIPLEGPGAVEDPFSWTIGTLKFKDAAGREQSTQDTAITSIELVGGRVVYLTDIDFSKEDQVSFLGTSWPAQVNRNALGQPLRIKETYPRGIGVHTQSTLYYDLDGSFDQLAFRIGLDDSAAPYGEARASVVLDGKTLWQSDTLKPGVLSEEILLPIKGGKRLELHADPAARLDVQGRVDWINIALKRN